MNEINLFQFLKYWSAEVKLNIWSCRFSCLMGYFLFFFLCLLHTKNNIFYYVAPFRIGFDFMFDSDWFFGRKKTFDWIEKNLFYRVNVTLTLLVFQWAFASNRHIQNEKTEWMKGTPNYYSNHIRNSKVYI